MLFLYLSPDSDKPSGGAQRQQSMISSELAARGYDVSAIVADYGQPDRAIYSDVELIKGVPETVSGIPSVLSALYSLARAMLKSSADVFLVRGAPRLASAACLITKALGKQFIFRLANDSDVDPSYLRTRYSPLFIRFYRAVVRRADAVIAQTERQQQLLREHFNTEVSLVPNGYDLPPERMVRSHEKRNHVLWVGSSDPEKKNPYLFLQLAKGLPDLAFTMISQPIAGKEDFHYELQQEAAAVPNLCFVGPVAPNEIHDYYKTAVALVNTSNYEGFPNTFLEAWRYETPIASLYFDLDGLLKSECGGVKAGSMEKLVAAVDRLSSDFQYRGEFGKEGREYMKKHFSLHTVVDLYEEAFERALS